LAAAGGMADMNGVLQVEMRRHGREVVGVMVHVVAVGHLAGAAMAAAIMGDDPKAVVLEKQHLCVPVVGRQRPAVAEHDRLPLAPILVEDLDAVLGRDGGHGEFSSCYAVNVDQAGRCKPAGLAGLPPNSITPAGIPATRR